ncbi:MAG TPA: alpha-L-rhamnosidase N-terminal domain-containing protein, partial [Acidobacteriota bacterium]|nr:alpha-L-rhamnosidase N-terminal domain-containing protein [Acidobacteriota bacterium]
MKAIRPAPILSLSFVTVLLAFSGAQLTSAAPVSLTGLRCEYKTNPLGIDVPLPRLGWQILSNERAWMQTAYQIRVAQDPDALSQGKELVWDSGKVASAESAHRVYAGPALRSGKRYYWHVRVWDAQGQPSAWSEAAWWEMGLLAPPDWLASWIEPDLKEDTTKSNPCPMLRKEFEVRGEVRSARAYAASHGLYEMYLNGRRVGEEVLTPGWTSYDDHIQYQTYDVTSQIQKGTNAIGVILGDGWYRGNLAFSGQRNTYGDKLALLVQIQLTFRDGTSQVIGTDDEWRAATGPILMSDIYNGESYDARLEKKGWSNPGYEDAS